MVSIACGAGLIGLPDRWSRSWFAGSNISPVQRWLLLAAVAVIGGCTPRTAPPPAPGTPVAVAVAPLELWLDASAPGGGDGTEARPYRALGEALLRAGAAPLRLHLRTGLYQGPFELP